MTGVMLRSYWLGAVRSKDCDSCVIRDPDVKLVYDLRLDPPTNRGRLYEFRKWLDWRVREDPVRKPDWI